MRRGLDEEERRQEQSRVESGLVEVVAVAKQNAKDSLRPDIFHFWQWRDVVCHSEVCVGHG